MLSNMEVFIDNATELAIEKLGQQIEKFNGASGGTIQLTSEGFSGDFFQKSFYNSLVSAQRRVDRYAANGAVATTDLSQSKYSEVKIAGGFGPILFEPSQLTWIMSNETEALNVISQSLVEAIMNDQLNTSIASLVGAISNVAGATNDISATLGITQTALNNTDAKFGDSSMNLAARIMRIVDILGKPIIVTDAVALREAGTPNKEKVLSLAVGAIKVGSVSNMTTNYDKANGKQRIEATYQADYDYTMGMMGYGWDETNGGKSPTDAELATGTNWDLFVQDIKHSAGTILISDEDK